MPVLPVLLRMERNGVLLDGAKLDAQSHELGKEMLEIEQKAYQAAGQPFNLNSPKQIQEILFEQPEAAGEEENAQRASPRPTRTCSPSSRSTIRCRSCCSNTAASPSSSPPTPTSCRAWWTPNTGRVHTTYSQATAVTGRLASNDPNLQNIPIRTPQGRRIREAFIAPPGCKIVSRRLFADRAAHHGAPLGRQGPAPRLRARRRRAPRHRRGGVRRAAGQGEHGRAAHRQGDQLRPHLRHERASAWRRTSASSAPPRRPTSSPTSPATRA